MGMGVSVALCTYNGSAYVAEQLESIAAQDRLPDELVVCDDASTDDTVAIVRDFAARAPFEVCLTVNDENLGTTPNFAQAIGLCRGEVIFLADQDDFWKPQKVRRLSEAFADRLTPAFAFSDAELVNFQRRPSGYRLWEALPFPTREQAQFNAGHGFDLLLRRNVVTGATLAFRGAYRDMLLPIPGGWVHDGWIALLLAAVGRGRAVAEPLIEYRQHGTQQIGARPESLWQKYQRRKRQGPALYGTVADNYTAALERLESLGDRGVDGSMLERLRRKVEHWRTRARMRSNGSWRLPIILRQLLRGGYGRYSSGWRSAVEDVLLS